MIILKLNLLPISSKMDMDYFKKLMLREEEIEERKRILKDEPIKIRFGSMKRVQENYEEYQEHPKGKSIKNPLIQLAESIFELKKITNWSNKTIAKEINISERQIYNYLRILNISKKIEIENKYTPFRKILKNFPQKKMYNYFKNSINRIDKNQVELLISKIFYMRNLIIRRKRSEEYKEKDRILQTNRWQNEEYKEKQLKAILHGLMKRPTSFELIIFGLCIKYNLPFFYTGDGTFFIGNKNPDFVNHQDKVVIEVFFSYYKIRDYGSVENYLKKRGEYFAKRGYRAIFIDELDLFSDNWEEICLNKIKNFIGT